MGNQVAKKNGEQNRNRRITLRTVAPVLAGGLTLGLIVSGKWRYPAYVFGIRTAEEPYYVVVMKDGNKEVRDYSSHIIAVTQAVGTYEVASDIAFHRLFRYISGQNISRKKMEMVAPVLQSDRSEKMAMNAPVTRKKAAHGWSMAFVLPSRYNLNTAPKPMDTDISLQEVPACRVAVLTFSGFRNEERFSKMEAELTRWTTEKGLKALSTPVFAGYDPPFTIPFLRRNEIHLGISK